jgi:3'-phosphoadenosine 5'-phosphosulfate sulfotransferase (PAPS reductase)/FAD synthetase
MKGKTIVVWYSCGAASTVAVMETIKRYGADNTIRVVNNPIAEEDPDNQRFLKDVEKYLGIKIERAVNRKYPAASCVEVWEKRQYMSGTKGAPCTHELKKVARQQWENENRFDYMVLGFTVEEAGRHSLFVKTERENVLPVLIDAGISKDDCYRIVTQAGLVLPRVYFDGYPNGNCIGCVKATSATYWNHVRKMDPAVFWARAEQSRRIGAKLVRCHPKYLHWCEQDDQGRWHDRRDGLPLYRIDSKGREKLESPRIYLDELPPEAKGRPMKGMDFECGIFCEEQP